MTITWSDKFIAWLTLLSGLSISAVAVWYSVAGLISIFAAAVIPIAIMGCVLEVGKLVATVWLKQNWVLAPRLMRVYLLSAIIILMAITSMGIFGFLSKAHMDQNLVSGDVQSKISIYDEKIKTARENIDANRRALKQLDEAVDQVMGRSTTESGAERSVQIRRQQGPERQRLIRDIETEQKKISDLNEARAPIAAEVRKVEAEVGPIKYIAALLYGDNPEANLLESAVRWVIILIVIVFDPLAIVLILAGTRHIEWERAARDQINLNFVPEPKPEVKNPEPEPPLVEPEPTIVEPAYLKPGVWFRWKPFSQPDVAEPQVQDPVDIKPAKETKFSQIDDTMYEIDGQKMHRNVLVANGYEWVLEEQKMQNLAMKRAESATFGNRFPENPIEGQMHVYTGLLPSKLCEYKDGEWCQVEKTISDAFTHNEAYISYLINRIQIGEIVVDDLTEAEYNLVKSTLQIEKSTNNPT